MQYDPIKRNLGSVFNRYVALRKLFYRLLDLLLLRAWHIKREVKRFEREKNGARKVLDAGSGFGQYTYSLARKHKDWDILGVDVKTEQIEDCTDFFEKIGLHNVDFQYADLTQFEKKDVFDLVLSVDVMEHIEEDELVFKNLCNSMVTGGMLLISTPSDQGGSDVHDHDHESFIDEHVRDGYGIREIQDKLKRAGFTQVDAKYSYGAPGKISWRLSMKYPILILNASRLFFIVLPFYYLLTYPLAFVLNIMDVRGHHKTGTGLIVKAWK